MKYTAYLLCEPGMDRPCFSHLAPSDAQRQRLQRTGGRIYALEIDIPDFVKVDGTLRHTLTSY